MKTRGIPWRARRASQAPSGAAAIEIAMRGAALLPIDQRDRLKGLSKAVMALLTDGTGGLPNWREAADCINFAEAMAEIGLCSDEDSRRCIAAASAALGAMYVRAHGGREPFQLQPGEVESMEDALLRFRVQVDHVSCREWVRVAQALADRVKQARAGNAPKGTEVIGDEP